MVNQNTKNLCEDPVVFDIDHEEIRRISREYSNPLFTDEFQLEVAIGAIHFRDKTIKNLREQIKNLKELALLKNDAKLVDDIQYQHLRNTNDPSQ
jgi:hypothetical protein